MEQNQTINQKVYVVASLKNLTNQTHVKRMIQVPLDSFDGHYIPNMDNIKSFNQTFLYLVYVLMAKLWQINIQELSMFHLSLSTYQ